MFVRKKKLKNIINELMVDAMTRKDLAINPTTKEYWFGKQTAFENVLSILRR